MSLQLNHTHFGAVMTNAFHKVHYVSGNKDTLHVDVRIYENEAAKIADENNFAAEFSFVMSSTDLVHDDGATDKNYTKQAYEFMKAAAFNDVRSVSRDYTTATDLGEA